MDGIEVVGVRGAYSNYMRATGMSNLGRMGAFARFAAGATVAALRGPRPDVIYATSPPLTMALPAMAASLRWRAPLVFEVRDLWPEAPIQMGALRNPLAQRLARALERFVYARSARLIALSPGIQAALPAGRTSSCPIRPTSTCSIPHPLPGPFQIAYFGAMGEANDLTSVVEAARLVPDVRFVLMGDGKRRAELEHAAPPNVTSEAAARLTWPGSLPSRAPASPSSRTCPCSPPTRRTSSSTRSRPPGPRS